MCRLCEKISNLGLAVCDLDFPVMSSLSVNKWLSLHRCQSVKDARPVSLLSIILHKFQVMHGGLFQKDDVKLDELRTIDRNRQPGEEGR